MIPLIDDVSGKYCIGYSYDYAKQGKLVISACDIARVLKLKDTAELSRILGKDKEPILLSKEEVIAAAEHVGATRFLDWFNRQLACMGKPAKRVTLESIDAKLDEILSILKKR